MQIDLSPQQDQAIAKVRAWLKDPNGPQIFRLFGYAGTGKTTLAKILAENVRRVLYATFTGKAALVLRSKGCEGASTIHSLIYSVEFDPITSERKFVLNPGSAVADADLLIIDEVSMVAEDLARDLLSFGTKLLVLGDPAQLPPVKGEGYFINAAPDHLLTEVHRQAAENPIIRMSMDVRAGKPIAPGQYGESLVLGRDARRSQRDRIAEIIKSADQIICGMNKTRAGMNARARELKGIGDPSDRFAPVVGDKLICLRNDHDAGLLNGSMWNVIDCELHQPKKAMDGSDRIPLWKMAVQSIDEPDREPQIVSVFPNFFHGTESDLHWKVRRCSDEFTFGQAITCHKAQGSQWDRPIIFDESGVFREDASKWLYTAVTRAAESLTLVL